MEKVIYNNKEYRVIDYRLELYGLNISDLNDIYNLENLKTIKFLDLQDNDINSISLLEKISSLKSLNLCNNKISEINGLHNFKSLEELNLSDNEIINITGLENLKNLKILHLTSNKIENIQGLENLTNLEDLHLEDNRINKISGLNNLQNLKNLYLNNNKIEVIENLSHLNNLFYLNLSWNSIHNITGLNNLKNLKYLLLNNNQIPLNLFNKLGGLEKEFSTYKVKEPQNIVKYCQGDFVEYRETFYYVNNRKLELIDKGILNISDIKHLRDLKNLERLNLRNNQINTISGLESLVNLKKLYLSNNKIKRIDNLAALIKLNLLALNDNQITEIINLDHLSKLKHLNLSNNQISEIKGLNNQISLKELELPGNKISIINNLQMLKSLEQLNLGSNEISEIQGLDNLVNLKRLNIEKNKLNSIQGIGNLKNLEILKLNHNSIKNVENLDNCVNLKKLHLANNEIEEIQGLEDLQNLEYINFEENKIDQTLYNILKFNDNNPSLFLSYCILKPIIKKIESEIIWSELITNYPYLKKVNYDQLRKICINIKYSEIQIADNYEILKIVTPEYLANILDNLIEPLPEDDNISYDFIKRKLSLISSESSQELCIYIIEKGLSKFNLYEVEKGIRKLGKRDLIFEEIFQSVKLINVLPNTIDENKYRDIIEDSILPNAMFQHIFVCENIFRKFIIGILKNNGINSINSLGIRKLSKKIDERKEDEKKKIYLPMRGDHEIYYLDLSDLKTIIINAWKYFEDKFKSQSWILERIDSLCTIRNRVAHNSGFLTIDELKSIETYSREIIKQVDPYIK